MKPPQDVNVVGANEAIPVKIEEDKRRDTPLPATTTSQEDITHAGQRRINLIWESTQALIALSITAAVIYCTIKKIDAPVITNAFFLVVSMYLIRTNHKMIGGVSSNYQGR